ncbi:hypothetical protein BDL97_14G031700 [Sphagnum fallax]|nr:hypothetical protein BDL97_14G031700 [Sphagnum fallax]
MAEKGGDEESLLANFAVPSRASSSYTIEPGRETLAGSRSSSSESLGSRRESTNSLFSRRPSDWGSRYGIGTAFVQLDDAGIYLSSLSITILLSTLGTIGIILFALVVTFAILLGHCQKSLPGPGVTVPDPCASFVLNGELNNLQGWIVPSECQDFVAHYVDSGQYSLDFSRAVDAGRQYLKPIVNEADGLDMIVLDIDDTCISHVPYYRDHHFGAELFNLTSWQFWVMKASAPPLEPMLSLYTELRALNWSFAFITGRSENERDLTEQNLLAAGYEGWAALILRSEENEGVPAVEYKTKERLKLEEKGFRIWSGFGDQWSDLTGSASGSRTFKLPNPMYYIY